MIASSHGRSCNLLTSFDLIRAVEPELISGSGSGSRYLKLLAPVQTFNGFWLRLQNDLVH